MFKTTIVAWVIAAISLLCVACGNDAKAACEHMNDLCAGKDLGGGVTMQKTDCSESEKKYDEMNDDQKKTADKMADCILDANDCEAAMKCGGAASN